jgi:hypothetical protein
MYVSHRLATRDAGDGLVCSSRCCKGAKDLEVEYMCLCMNAMLVWESQDLSGMKFGCFCKIYLLLCG